MAANHMLASILVRSMPNRVTKQGIRIEKTYKHNNFQVLKKENQVEPGREGVPLMSGTRRQRKTG